ncbi:MAG: hypothetical protein K2M44_00015 [Clostridia bacterium]|nr:hypothetical protein [Clostridia bacterium]
MEFKERLDLATDNKYRFLRVQDVFVNKADKSMTVAFSAPYSFCDTSLTDSVKDEILCAVKQIFISEGVDFDIKIEYKKVYYNEEVIARVILQYLSRNYNAFCSQIPAGSIKVSIEGDNIAAEIRLPDYMYTAFISNSIAQSVKEYIDSTYCTDIKVKLIDLGDIGGRITFKPAVQMRIVKGYYHSVDKASALLGDTITSKATYIAKAPTKGTDICIAGTVSALTTKTSKKGYFYHTFMLDDTTGKVECIKFTRSKKRGVLGALGDGAQVIVMGDYPEEDGFGSSKLVVNRLSICEIDYDAIDMSEPIAVKEYRPVASVPYDDNYDNLMQMSAFNSPAIIGHTFVSLDFETTGLNPATCDIIEIGLARMVDGKVTEYFDTFVDPKKHIPEDSSRVHGIYDSDVRDAPYIESVLPDVLKFIGDAPIIAHNGLGYDYIILDRICMQCGIAPPKGKRIDTLVMADTLRVEGRHNLSALCQHFGISLVNAHRAYADCIATAKLYAALEEYSSSHNNG